MKIMQLCTKVPFPPKDGGAAGIYVFSKAFEAYGHLVDVLAVNPPKHFVEEQQYNQLPENIHIHPVSFDTHPRWYTALLNLCFSKKSYHVDRFFHADYAICLRDLLLKNTPDIIQIEGIYMASYIPLIRQHSKARIVIREHNIEHLLWNEIACKEKHFLKRLYLKIQAKRIRQFEVNQLDKADAVTFITQEDKFAMTALCPNLRSIILPFGVNYVDRQPSQAGHNNCIYFLGALDWIPNQEALLWFIQEVWPILHKEIPAISFHVAGRNAPPEIEAAFAGIENLIYHGEVLDAEVFAMPFAVTVVPLFTGSGIRVKIIEAMEQGKVVIASSKALVGIPAVAGKHLLIADTVDQYVTHLIYLFAKPEKIIEISQQARLLVAEQYDIQVIAEKLIHYYNDIDN